MRSIKRAVEAVLAVTLALGVMTSALPADAQEVLPFPPKPSGSTAGRTMQESIYSPLPAVSRLPKDAPNILIVLIDDVGPAQTDTYGGEIHTPTLSRIAKAGISYNRFHTTAMCSPTRAALLTGRNHHRVANGQITELANDWDGYMGTIPKSSATVAEVLKDYGYHTGGLGQVAQHARGADDRRRPVRLLADRLRLRVLLRLPRRRSVAVRADAWCATPPSSSIPTRPAATTTIT